MPKSKTRKSWSKEECAKCGMVGYASRAEPDPSNKPYICGECESFERGRLSVMKEQEQSATNDGIIQSKAWYNWLKSKDAKEATQPGFLERQYIENRLFKAFHAGYDSANKINKEKVESVIKNIFKDLLK